MPHDAHRSTTSRPSEAASQKGAVSSVTAGGIPISMSGRKYTLTPSATLHDAVGADRITLGAAALPEPEQTWLAAVEDLPV